MFSATRERVPTFKKQTRLERAASRLRGCSATGSRPTVLRMRSHPPSLGSGGGGACALRGRGAGLAFTLVTAPLRGRALPEPSQPPCRARTPDTSRGKREKRLERSGGGRAGTAIYCRGGRLWWQGGWCWEIEAVVEVAVLLRRRGVLGFAGE